MALLYLMAVRAAIVAFELSYPKSVFPNHQSEITKSDILYYLCILNAELLTLSPFEEKD
jgi:hypothetical protein